ncbi:hypothetical protein Tco_0483993, partial [Tanacetum coccineum]
MGGRGLRQGDPMSPYLFTLVMEIISWIVQDKVDRNKEFGYHFGCKQMKLTHVFVFLLPKSVIEDINKLLKGFLWNQGELSRAGILQSFIAHRDIYNVRRNDSMVVKDIVDNGVCMWLEEWIAKYPDLALHHRIALNNDKEDTIV